MSKDKYTWGKYYLPDKLCPACGRAKAIKPKDIGGGDKIKLHTTDICPLCWKVVKRSEVILDKVINQGVDPESPKLKQEIEELIFNLPYLELSDLTAWDKLEALRLFKNWIGSAPFREEFIKPNNAQWIDLYRHPEAQYTDQEGMYNGSGELIAPANFIDIEVIRDYFREDIEDQSEEAIELMRIIGLPANIDWALTDPTSDILYSFSTVNPLADFSEFTAPILEVKPNQAPDYRLIIHAIYRGYRQKEIANKLGISQGEVSKRFEKMKKIIRGKIRDQE